MIRASRSFAIITALAVAACGHPPARAPGALVSPLPRAFAAAFALDATGTPKDATAAHLAIVRTAAESTGDPWRVPALEASLAALCTREMPSLGKASGDIALALRSGSEESTVKALNRIEDGAKGPFARGLIAQTLTSMAERRGDAAEAERQRQASGCVREALVVGPTTWASVTGTDTPG
ncbi:MAG: hypothetical protein ACREJ3_14225, partial [Polyangiaceae bacterium]